MPIPGFENITYPLTKHEYEVLLPIVVSLITDREDKSSPIKSNSIINSLLIRGFKLDPSRFRKIINVIRKEQMIIGLVATSKGYYISTDPAEIKRQISSLESKENEIRRVRKSFEKTLHQITGTSQFLLNL